MGVCRPPTTHSAAGLIFGHDDRKTLPVIDYLLENEAHHRKQCVFDTDQGSWVNASRAANCTNLSNGAFGSKTRPHPAVAKPCRHMSELNGHQSDLDYFTANSCNRDTEDIGWRNKFNVNGNACGGAWKSIPKHTWGKDLPDRKISS